MQVAFLQTNAKPRWMILEHTYSRVRVLEKFWNSKSRHGGGWCRSMIIPEPEKKIPLDLSHRDLFQLISLGWGHPAACRLNAMCLSPGLETGRYRT
ncbi:hypothetical protein BRADI_4g01295v3 [Brachypodium distachyon]|uniref:Uncharacterized protein n=1 Tax=Brachypodium distachyon TaxID=15368 RepID=A0A0Q3GXZ7_BRADI|nr:hypothetical protein BRADI_4g01295v3 [Brachypodium distachyon]